MRRDPVGGSLAVGIDVGAAAAWAVALELGKPSDGAGVARIASTALFHPVDPAALRQFCVGAASVAIDAPDRSSSLPHAGDARLAAKFQRARCAEVALRLTGVAVPWVTPASGEPVAGWMATGWSIWSALRDAGVEPLETYPHAVFARLAGRALLHKSRPSGLRARAQALVGAVELPEGLAMWSHDGLDALAAALVAWQAAHGTAVRIDCASDTAWGVHDGSAIWLPPTTASTAAGLG